MRAREGERERAAGCKGTIERFIRLAPIMKLHDQEYCTLHSFGYKII